MQANFQLSVVSLPAEDEEVIEEQGPVSFSSQRRPPSSTTWFSTPASSTTGSLSRSRTTLRVAAGMANLVLTARLKLPCAEGQSADDSMDVGRWRPQSREVLHEATTVDGCFSVGSSR
jgi:hypothetical protein